MSSDFDVEDRLEGHFTFVFCQQSARRSGYRLSVDDNGLFVHTHVFHAGPVQIGAVRPSGNIVRNQVPKDSVTYLDTFDPK